MYFSCISTIILLLLAPISQVLAIVSFHTYKDRSYAYVGEQVSKTEMHPDIVKAQAEIEFKLMTEESTHHGVERPDTMACIWVPNHGLIFQSSIKKTAPGETSAGVQILDGCHRYHGNCAEMALISYVEHNLKLPLKDSMIAVYGVQNKQTGVTGYMAPCGYKDGAKGCADYCHKYGIHVITA